MSYHTASAENSRTKLLLLAAVVLGSTSGAIVLWEGFPKESIRESSVLVANALGAWLMTTVMVFVMTWVFYKLMFGIVKYIWERFYRTPTL